MVEAARPHLKWAGGKNQILKELLACCPAGLFNGEITKYFELCLGGGALFYYLRQNFSFEKIYLNDRNQDLILSYRIIQQQVDNLILALEILQEQYYDRSPQEQERMYYQIRDRYNRQCLDYCKTSNNSIKRAAYLIFLNKCCFNGLYRVSKTDSNFNTSWGKRSKPKICDTQNLILVSQALQGVTLAAEDFTVFSDAMDSRSLAYFDPPYRAFSKTANFNSYCAAGFSDVEQGRLAEHLRYLSQERGVKIMMSNGGNLRDPWLKELYAGFEIKEVEARRNINSNGAKRGKIPELVITNYELEEQTEIG